jgi:shikimate dehydrogenase
VRGLNTVVLGAGGAARSIVDALGRAGASRVSVINRTRSSAVHAASLAPGGRVGVPSDIASADLVVNATSVGMAGGPSPDALGLDPTWLRPDQIVADIVYQPLVTPLLAAAGQVGATTVGGLGMLLHQAALAFEIWTGHEAPVEAMAAAVQV